MDMDMNESDETDPARRRITQHETVRDDSSLAALPGSGLPPRTREDTSKPDMMAQARARIAAQKGKLRGWRPLLIGEVAVVALEVLGAVRGEEEMIGLRVMVAGRTAADIDEQGDQAASLLLRRRSVLPEGYDFHVINRGLLHFPERAPAGEIQGTLPGELAAEMLSWPWRGLVIHVPASQLPSIAGLATDTVVDS